MDITTMIIDKILDRYDGDAYDPKDFYDAMMSYEEGTDFSISRALDSGEEEDIKRELCAYIDDGYYNPKIKDFINSVKWLEADDGKDYSKEFDILGESKKGEFKFKCSMAKKKESLVKKSEANNDWVAYYFCKDPKGYEWAVMPHQVIGNGANVGCVNDRGGQDDIGLKYALEECEPLNQSLESSKIYKAVSDGEDRTIIPLTLADATRIANAGNDKLAVLGIIADMHLRKSESKKDKSKFRCSMEKKKESLVKKSEADYGAMTWTVTVEFDDNGKSVRKDYVVKAHNRESAIDQAKLKPQHTNPDAKNIKVTYCKLGESLVKKHTCSMQKKESLAKKCEEYIPNVRERLWSFIDAGFITTEEIGDYLLRALSVDTLENVYGWLVQDEMIPSEETLADEHQLKFGDDGELVSIETNDSTESKKS